MFLILHVLLISFPLHALQHSAEDGIGKKILYAVIFDAGSTGSRVSTYKFHQHYPCDPLVLASETFRETKPGIAHYHLKPQEGAKSIVGLLEQAIAVIPNEYRPSTPLVLRATAGLRILGSNESENLLHAIRKVFSRSGLRVDEKTVEIMDGVDEGIYSWFTINFLLGRVKGIAARKKTVAALELGGGSIQVTFQMDQSKHKLAFDTNSNFIQTISTPNGDMDLFTNSYLNLGLQAVRHAVFTSGDTKEKINYISECVNPIVKSSIFTYKKKDYYLSGKVHSKTLNGKRIVDFAACIALIKQKTANLIDPKPIGLKDHHIAAFGSFYTRAEQSGLISSPGGNVTVGQFSEKAKEICASENVDKPFLCFDLAYISILLKDGYGLDPTTTIHLYEKIEDHKVSWALGCAYNLLAGIPRNKKSFD